MPSTSQIHGHFDQRYQSDILIYFHFDWRHKSAYLQGADEMPNWKRNKHCDIDGFSSGPQRCMMQDVQEIPTQGCPSEPKSSYNLISITKWLKVGFHLIGDANKFYVAVVKFNDQKEMHFNVKVLIDTSFLLGVHVCRVTNIVNVHSSHEIWQLTNNEYQPSPLPTQTLYWSTNV